METTWAPLLPLQMVFFTLSCFMFPNVPLLLPSLLWRIHSALSQNKKFNFFFRIFIEILSSNKSSKETIKKPFLDYNIKFIMFFVISSLCLKNNFSISWTILSSISSFAMWGTAFLVEWLSPGQYWSTFGHAW